MWCFRITSEIKEADLYVLDEPTASLNGTETDRLFNVLKNLKNMENQSSMYPIDLMRFSILRIK